MATMHPLQAMVDGWSQQWQKDRAESQMTLGQLIEALKDLPPDRLVVGFGRPDSYRGYYCDLSFEPAEAQQGSAELLAICEGCMGRVFQGYKGGDYVMGELTPLWFAEYGETGDRLMGLNIDNELVSPILAPEDDSP